MCGNPSYEKKEGNASAKYFYLLFFLLFSYLQKIIDAPFNHINLLCPEVGDDAQLKFFVTRLITCLSCM